MVQQAHQVRVLADLGDGKTVKLVAHCASAEEVGGATADLPRARSAERESNLLVLVKPVHLVEQRGDLLHLIDDDL